MISVVKSTTRRQAHVKARSSSATSAAAATATAAAAVVKNSSASNSNNNNKSNHFQNTGDDAAFGSLTNHLADSYEKASLFRRQKNYAEMPEFARLGSGGRPLRGRFHLSSSNTGIGTRE